MCVGHISQSTFSITPSHLSITSLNGRAWARARGALLAPPQMPATIADQIAELAATPHVGDLLVSNVRGVVRPKSVRPVRANWQQAVEPGADFTFRADIELQKKSACCAYGVSTMAEAALAR
eukprot:7375917-Prymnesium_polylepis.1